MDPLSDVLSLLNPTSYGFRGLNAGGDWSIAYPAAPGIKVFAIDSGHCSLCLQGDPVPLRLSAGDLVLLPGGPEFRLCSETTVTPIDAIGFLTAVAPGEIAVLNGGGGCFGLGGYFTFEEFQAGWLLELLPPVLHFTGESNKAVLRGSIERVMNELREALPGGALLIEHALQSLLVEALRVHIAAGEEQRVGWLFALADRRLSAAMRAMHARPAHKWTVEALARIASMSRSSFAAKFRATVGEPPLEYLTRWRMRLAIQKLTHSRASIGIVGAALGYESESAFTAAFKRVLGMPPRQFLRTI